ncbi:MAG: hypothetical protein QOD97_2316 [Mycobacterium sp.]|jgi:hypothetical protein|nr:hypothetical protein [Mycobacterium sp.]
MAGRCSCRAAYLMPRQVGGGSLASSQGGVSACPPLSLPMPGVWRTGPTCRREPLFMNQSRCRPSLTDTAGAEESLFHTAEAAQRCLTGRLPFLRRTHD